MDELNQLCDEIIQMIPSPNLKDTTTSQFKTFLKKLEKDKLNPEQIKALKQAYDYFNYLIGNVSDSMVTESKDTKDSKQEKEEQVKKKEEEEERKKKEEEERKKKEEEERKRKEKKEDPIPDPDSEMIEILLNLAEVSESKT